MGLIQTRQHEMPHAPVDIADEVELWARQSGRHASLAFVPTLFRNGRIAAGTWVVKISLRADDGRMGLYREGKVSAPPTEDVWLHEPNPAAGREIPGTHGLKEQPYRPLNLMQLGASGVRQFLEKGDTWSGRGEYGSLEEQLRKVRQNNEDTKAKVRATEKEDSRLEQRDKRRSRFRIPFLSARLNP